MKRKKRKIFQTPEEYAEWKARSDARLRELHAHIERLGREPGVLRTPEERDAWMTDPEVRRRYMQDRIDRIEAELEAKRKSA